MSDEIADLKTSVDRLGKIVDRLAEMVLCPVCTGGGEVDTVCGNCEGDGYEYWPCRGRIPCSKCDGTGRHLR